MSQTRHEESAPSQNDTNQNLMDQFAKRFAKTGIPPRVGFFATTDNGIIIEYANLDEVCKALSQNNLGNYTIPKDARQPSFKG